MDLVTKTLHHLGKNKKDAFVVQIGAMDGINFDDTRGFLDMYRWNALLVEPIPAIYEELKKNFSDRTNYIFENSAIANYDGEIVMLTIPPDVIERENLHPGYKGMSAVYPLKNGFGSSYQRDIDVKGQFGINMVVPCLTLDSLFIKHNVSKIDIFICDAEGYDWEIFKQLDLEKFQPDFMKLEYINLTEEEKSLMIKKLEDNDYVISISQDVDCVKRSLYNEIYEPDTISKLIEKYGSDKKKSGYTTYYDELFLNKKDNLTSFLEIGIGTLDPSILSSFCGITGYYSHYKPGGSLKTWRDYFLNAMVYGIDVADDCQFEEERIKTFKFSSLDKIQCDLNLGDLEFDIILDDGLHTGEGQLKTLTNLFDRVKSNGIYIIEDCGGGGDGSHIFRDYEKEFMEIVKDHEFVYLGNVIFIRKNYSGKGNIGSFKSFCESSIVYKPLNEEPKNINTDLTIVTGLWNIGRPGRDFDHYISCFKKFLTIPNNMVIYIPQEYEYLIWEVRDKSNTFVKIANLDYIRNMYNPFWDKTQSIRNNPEWYNKTGENGWLRTSPQAILEWYNPIVQSKMFLLHDATVWNPFNNEYFIWLDAGINNTVDSSFLTEKRALDKIIPYMDNFLFLSYPYESAGEIHGFDFNAMNNFAGEKVKYVCRGGLFGGKKDDIAQANSTYYSTLLQTLESGYMGTEESVFTIMSYREPNIYRRYSLDDNGLIIKFIDALINDNVVLEPVTKKLIKNDVTQYELSNKKTNLYILTFNFPQQLQHTINTMEKVPEWLEKPHLVLIDNSTDENAVIGNKSIAEKYNMEYIKMERNTGICGGRQKAAEHFDESDADFMFFFEDDMTVNPPELTGEFCRNGFRKYIPNLYQILHKIMMIEDFDFLKMSFTEVYFDNDKALPWYNVPQYIRTRDWPEYDKLPISGLDPNAPSTKYSHIKIHNGVAYIIGEVNYCNWPMIVSKSGNKKMFIDTKWAHPYEQTWSSHIYQLTKEGKIHSGLLLASPIWHDRIIWYKPEERREN